MKRTKLPVQQSKQKPRRSNRLRYDPELHPHLAKWMARRGFPLYRIAQELRIARCTFFDWMKDYPEFAAAVREGQMLADAKVEDALYRRATGYEYEERKTVQERGTIVREETVRRHVVPDVKAQIFWLKNRQPDRWKDTTETQITGPIKLQVIYEDATEVVDIVTISAGELDSGENVERAPAEAACEADGVFDVQR